MVTPPPDLSTTLPPDLSALLARRPPQVLPTSSWPVDIPDTLPDFEPFKKQILSERFEQAKENLADLDIRLPDSLPSADTSAPDAAEDTSSDPETDATQSSNSALPAWEEVEAGLQAQGIDNRLVDEIKSVYDQVAEVAGPEASRLFQILLDSITAGNRPNRQTLETTAMVAEAFGAGDLSGDHANAVLDAYEAAMEDGRINRREHAEISALIDDPEAGAADAPASGQGGTDAAEASSPAEPSMETAGSDPATEGGSGDPAAEAGTDSEAPAADGTDPGHPLNWDTEYGTGDGIDGLSGPEFLDALYGSGAMESLSLSEQQSFGPYASALYKQFLGEGPQLDDRGIQGMIDAGYLVETADGWALDLELVQAEIKPEFSQAEVGPQMPPGSYPADGSAAELLPPQLQPALLEPDLMME